MSKNVEPKYEPNPLRARIEALVECGESAVRKLAAVQAYYDAGVVAAMCSELALAARGLPAQVPIGGAEPEPEAQAKPRGKRGPDTKPRKPREKKGEQTSIPGADVPGPGQAVSGAGLIVPAEGGAK